VVLSLCISVVLVFRNYLYILSMYIGFLSTTAWRVLRLRAEGRPPDTMGKCKYIK